MQNRSQQQNRAGNSVTTDGPTATNNNVYTYPYNNPIPRPSVSMMARPLPSSRQLIAQEMAKQDIELSRTQYNAPSQVSSNVNTIGTVTVATDYGFLTQGIMLDTSMPVKGSFGRSPDSFRSGKVTFQFPIIGSQYSITNVVAVEGLPFFIPQVSTDINIHPEYLYNQYVGVVISECTNDTNTFQPILGNGANIPYITGPAVGSSLYATPLLQRVAFNTAIREIDKFTINFYRLSSDPSVSILEPLALPKTNIEVVLVPAIPIPTPYVATFQVINNDTVTEFIRQDAYLNSSSTYKAGIYINYATSSPRTSAVTALIKESASGWYAANFNYINNTFTVPGLDLSTVQTDAANMTFVVTILPNRINLQFNFISRTGAKTNNLTVIL